MMRRALCSKWMPVATVGATNMSSSRSRTATALTAANPLSSSTFPTQRRYNFHRQALPEAVAGEEEELPPTTVEEAMGIQAAGGVQKKAMPAGMAISEDFRREIEFHLDRIFERCNVNDTHGGVLQWSDLMRWEPDMHRGLVSLSGDVNVRKGLQSLGFTSERYLYDKVAIWKPEAQRDSVYVAVKDLELRRAIELFERTLESARALDRQERIEKDAEKRKKEEEETANDPEAKKKPEASTHFTFKPPALNYPDVIECNEEMYYHLMSKRQELPIWSMRDEVCKMVRENQVTCLLGATGCGKTTQVPQFVFEDCWHNKEPVRVVVTQPRRISAISVAERVAAERGDQVGGQVGYQVRFSAQMTEHTQMFFCTVGILLRHLLSSPDLDIATHIIVDEVHERDVNTDFLLLILSRLLKRRPNLKLVMMSATVDPSKFVKYFPNAATIEVPGKTNFPIKDLYMEDIKVLLNPEDALGEYDDTGINNGYGSDRGQGGFKLGADGYQTKTLFEAIDGQPPTKEHILMDGHSPWMAGELAKLHSEPLDLINNDLILDIVDHIDRTEPRDSAILIFLPGANEMMSLTQMLSKRLPAGRNGELFIASAHSMLPASEQAMIFEIPPEGQRKIVLATNIAETAITIEDVVHIIDCGRMKFRQYDASKGTASIAMSSISKANGMQRRGRAGRVRAGCVYRLYSKYQWDAMPASLVPEMQRTPVEELALQVKSLKMGNVEEVLSQCIDPPPTAATKTGIAVLERLGVLTDDEELTELGKKLADMPIHPILGKLILFGAMFGCLSPILTIAASLGHKSPFDIQFGYEMEMRQAKDELAQGLASDHLVVVSLFNHWMSLGLDHQQQFCSQYFLSNNTFEYMKNMREEIEQTVSNYKIDRYGEGHDEAANAGAVVAAGVLEAVLCSGLKPCRVQGGSFFPTGVAPGTSLSDANVHPGSVSSRHDAWQRYSWLVYFGIQKTKKLYMYDATPVSSLSMLLFSSKAESVEGEDCVIELNRGGPKHSIQVATPQVRESVLKLHNLIQNEFVPEVIGKPVNKKHRECIKILMKLVSDPAALLTEEGEDEDEKEKAAAAATVSVAKPVSKATEEKRAAAQEREKGEVQDEAQAPTPASASS